jgi:hypothetical protein
VIGPVTRGPVAVAVEPVLARQQAIERREEVVVRPGADLDDHEPGGRVRHEHGQEPVTAAGRLGREGTTLAGQIEQPATRAGPDRKLPRLYGKMLRMASRRRPSPPATGADS